MTSRQVRRTTHTTYSTSSRGAASASAAAAGGGDIGEGNIAVETDDTASDSGISAASPLSPHRLNRQQEKQQLQHLNDRLAQYIDRVRSLETENQRLSLQIRNTEEVVTRERNSVRVAFEAELADARRLLDETAREKARVQIEAAKFKALVDDLQSRINKLERDLKDSETRRLYVESQVQDLQGKLNTADSQRKHWEDEAKKLRLDNENLRKLLENLQKQLEDETLQRVDLENRTQSLREELAFKKNLYEQELDETRRKRQVEITEINQELEDEYKAKLQDALHQMREQLDTQIRINRKEIEEMYESKMADMRDMADRNRESATGAREEAKRVRLQLDILERDKSKFDGLMHSLEKEIKELKDQLRTQSDDYYSRLASREDEIRRLNEEIQKMMQDYQDLMDTKIQLDVEIEAYRRLLEGEEARLHLSPTPPAGGAVITRSSVGDRRGVKRKRVFQERDTEVYNAFTTNNQADGDVEIGDHDLDGLFVKVHNKSDKEVSMGGWVLKREGGGVEVTYKFHSRLILRPGATITVWSTNAPNVIHSPPNDLVMKNQNWPVGDRIRTVLITSEEQETAWRESVRSSSSKRTSFRTAGGGDYGLDGADGDQRCSVM